MDFANVSSSVTGLSYLSGNIYPWDDYVILKVDDDTSISVKGQADLISSDYVHFPGTVTVREVVRAQDGYGYFYDVDEYTTSDVTCHIVYPYYAYGNVIGVNYALPSSNNITAMCAAIALTITFVLSIFRVFWSLRKCFGRKSR